MKERIPLVYPALLSKVAEAFRDRVTVGPRMKDSIEYQNAFDGREAVVRRRLLFYFVKNRRAKIDTLH